MMRPREIRAARRAARPVKAKWPPHVAQGVTPAQLEAAENLREEFDVLCMGAPSDAQLFLAMARALK